MDQGEDQVTISCSILNGGIYLIIAIALISYLIGRYSRTDQASQSYNEIRTRIIDRGESRIPGKWDTRHAKY